MWLILHLTKLQKFNRVFKLFTCSKTKVHYQQKPTAANHLTVTITAWRKRYWYNESWKESFTAINMLKMGDKMKNRNLYCADFKWELNWTNSSSDGISFNTDREFWYPTFILIHSIPTENRNHNNLVKT